MLVKLPGNGTRRFSYAGYCYQESNAKQMKATTALKGTMLKKTYQRCTLLSDSMNSTAKMIS